MKAPLIAVLSVGIAAAVPAVAISAATPNDVKAIETDQSSTSGNRPTAPIGTSHRRRAADMHQRRLAKRFLKLRKRLEPADRRARRAQGAQGARTAPAALVRPRRCVRAIRKLRKRIRSVRADLRDKRAGLTPGVRATLKRIAACESHGNPRAIGGGGAYRGKYQFSYGTWASVGGKGDPARPRRREQDRRAAMLLTRSGRGHWPVCG